MGRGRGEVGAAVAAGREHHRLAAEAVDRAVLKAQSDDAAAGARGRVHDQVEREIFDEEIGVVAKRLLIERVEHGVAGAVGGGAGALGGRPFAHILHHAAEGALVDPALRGAREGYAGMLQLVDRGRRLADHIFDRVLIAEPVRALDGVVHVPGPVIRTHIAERGRDPALGGDGVRARREHLGDVGRLQPALGGPHGGAKPGPAGADHDHVVLMVDDLVGRTRAHAPAPLRNSSFRY